MINVTFSKKTGLTDTSLSLCVKLVITIYNL